MILLIDNYDSFSYNLYQLAGMADSDIKVIRNDEITVDEIKKIKPDLILLSPGPGRPESAGICLETVAKLKGIIPIFGVCLGHQTICQAYGAEITYAKQLMHGKVSNLELTDKESVLFKGINQPMRVGRYHSLAAKPETIPSRLKITAITKDGEIMAVEDSENKVYGVQFHPESILTENGMIIMKNVMENAKAL